MKKLIILMKAVLLVTGCGSVAEEKESSVDESVVVSVKELAEPKVCTLKNDGAIYHSGVDFEDSELCRKVTEYCTDIQDKYEPLNEKELEQYRSSEVPKGAYISAKLDNGLTAYMRAADDYISISGTVYHTVDHEAGALRGYLVKYMAENTPDKGI